MPSLDVLTKYGRNLDPVEETGSAGVVQVSESVEVNGLGTLEMTTRSGAGKGHLSIDGDDGVLDVAHTVFTRLDDGAPTAYKLLSQRRDRRSTNDISDHVVTWTGQHPVSYALARTGLGVGFDLVPGDNRVRFEDLNPFELLTKIITTVGSRGAMAGVTLDCTPTHDSNGDLWEAHATTQYRTFAQSDYVIDVLDDAVERGKFDWQVAGTLLLRLFNPGNGHRYDQDDPPITLDSGIDATQGLQNRSMVDAATVCIVSGAPGSVVTVDLSADYPNFSDEAYAECTLDFTEVTDPDILELAGTLEIRRRMGGTGGNGVVNQMNLSLPLKRRPTPGRPPRPIYVPGTDFQIGDWVALRAGGEIADPWRVVHYVLQRQGDRTKVTAELNLGTRLDTEKARYARMLARLGRQVRTDRTI